MSTTESFSTPEHGAGLTDATPPAATVAATVAATHAAVNHQFVTFSMAGEMFAVPMGPVQEIIRVPEVARVPLAPAALLDLSNLRGRVLPIVSLRRLFNTDDRPLDDASRALVINLGQPLGFVVDRVASVVSVEPAEIEPASAIQSTVQADFLTGVINRTGADGQRQMLLVLDFDRLVRDQFGSVRSIQTANAAGLAGEPAAATVPAASADELRLVSFTVARQEYAIAIASVQEIVQVPAVISGVPNAPRHVLGLISLRERLLPLVSLRSLFGLPAVEPSEHHRIVVVALPGGAQVGLVTDTVKEVLSVPRSQTEDMPGVLSRDSQMQDITQTCRLEDGKRLVSILDPERLMGMQAIRDAVNTPTDRQTDPLEPPNGDAMSRSNTGRQAAADDDVQVVIFRLGAEEFGVPIMSVQEIVRVPEVLTRVPKTPRFVEGVINLRGTVLPVIDQRSRLGMDTIARNDRQRIMVYTLGGLRTGFIVDSVAEVLRIGRSQIETAPALSEEQGRLITQVAKLDGDRRLVMLIDPNQLLGASDVRALADSDGVAGASSGSGSGSGASSGARSGIARPSAAAATVSVAGAPAPLAHAA